MVPLIKLIRARNVSPRQFDKSDEKSMVEKTVLQKIILLIFVPNNYTCSFYIKILTRIVKASRPQQS